MLRRDASSLVTEGGYDLRRAFATRSLSVVDVLAARSTAETGDSGRASRSRGVDASALQAIAATQGGVWRRGKIDYQALMTEYKPQQLDKKWQQQWTAARAFEVDADPARPKFYCLEMFAYPSGHAHVGHVRNYIIGDVMARTKRMRGFNVLHPFGWDAFGLPAENAAIKTGTHPETSTLDNIAHMKGQLQRLGISYAWEREIATCLPDYYKFNQWIFLKMFERGLAYRKRSTVNWCPSDQTVLANEQVVDGACWRCGTTGRDARSRAVVLPHHRLRRRAARRASTR